MIAMNSMAGVRAPEAALAIPRFEDGFVNMQEPLRQLAESVVNEMMSAEADRLCEATGNGRNGYRERSLVTCVGTLALRIPRLRTGSFFPDDVTGRYQRVDRAAVAAVSETCATGTGTRKVQRVAAAMDMERLSKDQVSAICEHLDSEVGELAARPPGSSRTPYPWVDADSASLGFTRLTNTLPNRGCGGHLGLCMVQEFPCSAGRIWSWRFGDQVQIIHCSPYRSLLIERKQASAPPRICWRMSPTTFPCAPARRTRTDQP